MDCSKLSSISSICFSSVTWMKTLRLGPSLAASRRVTRRAMIPASSSALTRARHGEGDAFGERDIREAGVLLDLSEDPHVCWIKSLFQQFMPSILCAAAL